MNALEAPTTRSCPPSAFPRVLFEEVDCPICGKRDYALLVPATYGNDVTETEILRFYSSSSDVKRMDALVRCRGCGLVLLNPRVREDIVVESYTSAVDSTFFKQNPNRIRTFTRLFRKVLRTLNERGATRPRVLDVGCAGGAFPKAAVDLGCSVIGVEPSAWLCEQGRKQYGLDLRPGVLTEQALPREGFDFVTLWDVLEHLTRPGENLDEIHRLLRTAGTLVVSVPDYDSLAQKVLRSNWPFFLNVHLFYFTKQTLSALLKKHGFEVTARFALWQTLEFGYVLERASAYVPGMATLARVLGPIRKMPMTYQLGQTVFIATKR